MKAKYKVGDRVQLINNIDLETVEKGTVRLVEGEMDSNYVYVYITADNDALNDKVVAGQFKYWAITEQNDPLLSPLDD